jgi:capsular exopolysaccharide synthesis family protein
MGRIEEALRRSGHRVDDREPAVGTSKPSENVFESPWVFRDAPAVRGPVAALRENQPGSATLQTRAIGEVNGLGRFHPTWLPRLVISRNPDPMLVEQFRALAGTLHKAQADQNVRVVMITSAEPDEGKSLTSVNLALTLSQSYRRRVLLIDADLRRPSLHEIAQLPGVTGLGEALKANAEFKLPIYRLSETLMLAPAGRPDMNPMSALTSPRMRQLLAEAAIRFDWVIMDAPPLGPIADASLLAPLSDATLLVVRAGRTHYSNVQKAVDVLGRERILGVVLNGADMVASPAYTHYYGSDASGQD